jgi:hypothetical protein
MNSDPLQQFLVEIIRSGRQTEPDEWLTMLNARDINPCIAQSLFRISVAFEKNAIEGRIEGLDRLAHAVSMIWRA